MKLKNKLSLGFGLVLLMTLFVAFIGFMGLQQVSNEVNLANRTNQMVTTMNQIREIENDFIIHGYTISEDETLDPVEKMEQIVAEFDQILIDSEAHFTRKGDLANLQVLQDDFEKYKNAFDDFASLEQMMLNNEAEMEDASSEAYDVIQMMSTYQKARMAGSVSEEGANEKFINNFYLTEDINKVNNHLLEARRDQAYYQINHQPIYADSLKEHTKQIQNILVKDEDIAIDEDFKVQSKKIINSVYQYQTSFDRYISLVDRQDIQQKTLEDASNSVEETVQKIISASQGNIKSVQNLAIGFTIAGALIALLIGIIATIYITRSITQPIYQLTDTAQQIAEVDLPALSNEIIELASGDLTSSLVIQSKPLEIESKDEVGQLAGAFNSMIRTLIDSGNGFNEALTSLRGMVVEVNDSAQSLSQASQQLSEVTVEAEKATHHIATGIQQVVDGSQNETLQSSASITQLAKAIDHIARGAQEQANAVSKASTATTKMNDAIHIVNNNIQAVLKQTDETAQFASEGAKIVEDTIQGMARIRTAVHDSVEKVQEMGERSMQIGSIIETISDIAGQTNLLALNAAIEAARAGEHGKGFAVVADEVGKLAERSGAATREIGELIQSIQKTVNDAVEAMDIGAKEVERGSDRAGNASTALKDILEHINLVDQQVSGVTSAAKDMDEAASLLVTAMDDVSAIVEENTAATEQMSASADEVSESIEGVSASAEEMSAQVEEIGASATSLAEMAVNLQRIMSSFSLENEDNLPQQSEDIDATSS